jgi:hypothetical protein
VNPSLDAVRAFIPDTYRALPIRTDRDIIEQYVRLRTPYIEDPLLHLQERAEELGLLTYELVWCLGCLQSALAIPTAQLHIAENILDRLAATAPPAVSKGGV